MKTEISIFNLPNALSISRLILCLPLLFLTPLSGWFLLVYTIAGVTDMIDGPLARHTKKVTRFGANLDAIADMLFIFVVLFRILPILQLRSFEYIWIVVVILMKFLSLFVGYMRHKELVFLHTFANKFMVLSLFAFPLFALFVDLNDVMLPLLIIATIALTEDLIINSTSKMPERDVKGLFFK